MAGLLLTWLLSLPALAASPADPAPASQPAHLPSASLARLQRQFDQAGAVLVSITVAPVGSARAAAGSASLTVTARGRYAAIKKALDGVPDVEPSWIIQRLVLRRTSAGEEVEATASFVDRRPAAVAPAQRPGR